MTKKNGNGGKKGKILDLNTRILIGIRDELRSLNGKVDGHTSILQEHTSILQEHTFILREHSQRLTSVERAIKELARETRRWVAHFDRDYMRLANDFDGIRSRVESCEQKLSLPHNRSHPYFRHRMTPLSGNAAYSATDRPLYLQPWLKEYNVITFEF